MSSAMAQVLAALVPIAPALVGAGSGWLAARRRPGASPAGVGVTVALGLYGALFVALWIGYGTAPSGN